MTAHHVFDRRAGANTAMFQQRQHLGFQVAAYGTVIGQLHLGQVPAERRLVLNAQDDGRRTFSRPDIILVQTLERLGYEDGKAIFELLSHTDKLCPAANVAQAGSRDGGQREGQVKVQRLQKVAGLFPRRQPQTVSIRQRVMARKDIVKVNEAFIFPQIIEMLGKTDGSAALPLNVKVSRCAPSTPSTTFRPMRGRNSR